MWPATLRALRELTRLALATLVLAVALGTAAATEPTSGIGLPAAPAAATAVARPVVEPIRAADAAPIRTGPTGRPGPVRARRSPARAGHHDPEPHAIPARRAIQTTTIPAAAIPADIAGWRAAAGEGEPARRGPPTA